MANPFKRADRHGAPSIRPTPPESAEKPMPDPMTGTCGLPAQTNDLLVNRPAASPSAETPMEPPTAPPRSQPQESKPQYMLRNKNEPADALSQNARPRRSCSSSRRTKSSGAQHSHIVRLPSQRRPPARLRRRPTRNLSKRTRDARISHQTSNQSIFRSTSAGTQRGHRPNGERKIRVCATGQKPCSRTSFERRNHHERRKTRFLQSIPR